MTELERRGFDVGMDPQWRVPVTAHRVLSSDQATARLVLANGPMAARWRATPGVVEAANVDLRSPAEVEEQKRLLAEVAAGLRAEGLESLVPLLDTNLFRVAIDQRVPEELRFSLNRILDIGLPTSVFIAPPDALVL